ncbi:hypothetical protein QBC42DRAFT_190653 [Cladorrhinum samala]|uniref:RING-type domain-containing protein n=1 Tax=Cladorrhinum samala TaxID=585594 RepID=A0AAV9HA02_9PEZI|nr:hypothetical protein QBC42DRAFT_190653 [Cladorrhinum samala]
MSSRARRVGARDSGVTLTLPESSSASTARRSSRTPHVSPIQKGNSSSAAKKRKRSESLGFGEEDYLDDVIDLVDKDAVPEEHRKQEKPKNYTRLRDFTCIICYEEATDLTVTFCGHMFCSGCLHSALTVDPMKRVCPVCRQKIDKEPANGVPFGPRAKGYFPLQLKVMSKKELEKKKNASSRA